MQITQNILRDYFNRTYFGSMPYGLRSALQINFGTDLEKINWALSLEETDSMNLRIKAMALNRIIALIWGIHNPSMIYTGNHGLAKKISILLNELRGQDLISQKLCDTAKGMTNRIVWNPQPKPKRNVHPVRTGRKSLSCRRCRLSSESLARQGTF